VDHAEIRGGVHRIPRAGPQAVVRPASGSSASSPSTDPSLRCKCAGSILKTSLRGGWGRSWDRDRSGTATPSKYADASGSGVQRAIQHPPGSARLGGRNIGREHHQPAIAQLPDQLLLEQAFVVGAADVVAQRNIQPDDLIRGDVALGNVANRQPPSIPRIAGSKAPAPNPLRPRGRPEPATPQTPASAATTQRATHVASRSSERRMGSRNS
jgi:hypothetical protein